MPSVLKTILGTPAVSVPTAVSREKAYGKALTIGVAVLVCFLTISTFVFSEDYFNAFAFYVASITMVLLLEPSLIPVSRSIYLKMNKQ